MPLYLCRWPNGDCSVVRANNKGEAVELLDEIGNAEGCPLIPLPTFMVHLRISDEGEVVFDSLGEATEHALFELAYPLLNEALLNVRTDQAGKPTSEGLVAVRDAVAKERKRVRLEKVIQSYVYLLAGDEVWGRGRRLSPLSEKLSSEPPLSLWPAAPFSLAELCLPKTMGAFLFGSMYFTQ